MSTFFLSKEQAQRTAKWRVVDASGIPLGRLASRVASVLRGKDKPTFTPHVDGGDFVVVINASQVVLTGNKKSQKLYRKHSGYIGGLSEISAGDLLEKQPEKVVWNAVQGMIPRGALGHQIIKKLKVYPGSEHPHLAQQPEEIKLTK